MSLKNRLPPLNALRAFEATSRHLSAKKAAEELHVTPAAISHQLKELESFLEIQLFKRLHRKLVLTETGKNYSAALQEIFTRLLTETNKITSVQENILSISVEPSFAIYWLMPRLSSFKKIAPDIDLRILSSYKAVDFGKTDINMAIRWGKGPFSGLLSNLLFRNELYPVCSPRLLKNRYPLRKPNDLKHYPLLHETSGLNYSSYPNWRQWLAAAGADKVDADSGIFLETGYLVLQAAINGQGVALERKDFVEPGLKAGYLVKPFDFSLFEKDSGYFLVYPEEYRHNPNILAFQKWILAQ